MPSTVVTTVGGATSNSYVSASDADTYFGDRLGAADWTNASDGDKAKALLQACVHVDMQDFLGRKRYDVASGNTNYQKLKWPRFFTAGAELAEDYQRAGGGYFPDGNWSHDDDGDPIIPTEVKNAQMEQALSLLQSPTGETNRVRLRAQGVERFSLGGYSETLTTRNPGILCYEAKRLLSLFIRRGAQLARG